MHYIFDHEAENEIKKFLEISAIGPWMAEISVFGPKKNISVDLYWKEHSLLSLHSATALTWFYHLITTFTGIRITTASSYCNKIVRNLHLYLTKVVVKVAFMHKHFIRQW